jgi:hypothetical protein
LANGGLTPSLKSGELLFFSEDYNNELMQTLEKEESKEATLTNEIIDKTVQAYQVLIKSKLLRAELTFQLAFLLPLCVIKILSYLR